MNERSTYRWPRGMPLFGLIGLYSLGFLVAAQPKLTSLVVGQVAVAAYFVVATLFCLYLYRFRLTLDATSIRAGAFFLKEMAFADIVRATYVHGHDSGKIILYARDGTQISLGDTIEDFGACARAINSRLPKNLSIAHIGRTMPSDALSGSDVL